MFTDDRRYIENPIDIWLLGNTGVRNPWRIQEGLRVYANSPVVGELRGVDNAQRFRQVLSDAGIIDTDPTKDTSGSIGRKWRLAFNQFGFTYPEVKKKDKFLQEELGPVDCITPIGRVFINADTVAAIQECYLRALTVPMEPLPEEGWYSPFRWSLAIMLKLEEYTGSTLIHFIEYAVCVQTSTPAEDIEEIAARILDIRERRKAAENKRAFDNQLIHEIWLNYPKKEGNFSEYADMNLRYMTTSGIAQRAGRGVAIVPEKRRLAAALAAEPISRETLKERYQKLCQGAPLPTDDMELANEVLGDLIDELNRLGIAYEAPAAAALKSAPEINAVRGRLELRIANYHEEIYAQNQRQDWEEIYEYMNLLIVNRGREKVLTEDRRIKVPKSEAAAYLEWTLWRAFLAINSLTNKPYEARRFKIDQDFLPVGTAAGRGPDMIFEFRDFVFVVEVTMSSNSRQEAMEGEPVRRHVADVMTQYGEKPVYGIFIANRVDSNTAETFRIGKWYAQNDRKMKLHIVPFTLKQFAAYFRAIFEHEAAEPHSILAIMEKCEESREQYEAPQWKRQIEQNIEEAVAELSNGII